MNGEIKDLLEKKLAEEKTDQYRLALIEAMVEHQAELTAQYKETVCVPRGKTIDDLRNTVYRWGGALSLIALILAVFGSKIIAAVWG